MADKTIQVGPLKAAPGEKVSGFVPVPGVDEAAAIPVTIINGTNAGPVLSVTGGTHGGEYPGIEAAGRFADSLEPEGLNGAVVVSRLNNPTAFQARLIYINPLDGKNLNRQFPGNPEGTASERIAATIFNEIIKAGDFYIDLHGGDISEALTPFSAYFVSEDDELNAKSLGMARAFGIRYINKGTTPGSTYSSAAQAGIPSILTESGELGKRDESMVEAHVDGLNNVLRHLGIVKEPEVKHTELVELEGGAGIRSEWTGFFYSTVTNGDHVEQGQVVGRVTDYFHNELATITAPISGPVIYYVHSMATNPGDPIMSIGRLPE